MLHDADRHEPLCAPSWDERAARDALERIVRDTVERWSPASMWPLHPLDADGASPVPACNLYFGAGGVLWALHYLHAAGAVRLPRSFAGEAEALPSRNRAWLAADGAGERDVASYLMGDTGLLLLAHWLRPSPALAAALEACIAGNVDHPARELMWGAPGTMLAALFLFRRTGQARWAACFRDAADALWSQRAASARHGCSYWEQDLYGHRTASLGAVHGFASLAAPIVRGLDLLAPHARAAWVDCIATTCLATAQREGTFANWPPDVADLDAPGPPRKRLMQVCHGAPGVVIALADLPSADVDEVLVAAGEAIWGAGPLAKGSNLCHGTGGNGYAFLALHRRTGEARWLARARAFAMHGIAQTDAAARRHGQLRYSLWTGDPGFAVYLWDCLRGEGAFPTLDAFFA